MVDDRKMIQIGEFARLAGTNLRTLRYYEEMELIEPAARSVGGFRLYDRGQLPRIAVIKRLRDLGLSLKEIAHTIAADGPHAGPVLLARVESAVDRQIVLLEARIHDLQQDLHGLKRSKALLVERCRECDKPFCREHCDPCTQNGEPLHDLVRALL